MMEYKDSLENDLKKRLEDYSVPLPRGGWDRLEREMKPLRLVPLWRTRRFAVAASVAVLALTSLSVWLVGLPHNGGEYAQELLPDSAAVNPAAKVILKPVAEAFMSPVDDGVPAGAFRKAAGSRQIMTGSPTGITDRQSYTVAVISHAPEYFSEADDSIASLLHPATSLRQQVHTESPEAHRKIAGMDRLLADRSIIARNSQTLIAHESHRETPHKWSVAFSAGNTPYETSDVFDGISRMSSYHMPLQEVSGMMSPLSERALQICNQMIQTNRDVSPTTEYHHKMPVTLGMTASWHLNADWALETGLTYTLLVSELTAGNTSYRMQDEQRLHYIGIPLKLQRMLWNSRRISLYAAAGGQMEKCISASLSSSYYAPEIPEGTGRTTFKVHPLQWSLLAAVGVQANLTSRLGLYLEPGMTYYFDDGTWVETIRKEHPLNFSLQVGVRYSFAR